MKIKVCVYFLLFFCAWHSQALAQHNHSSDKPSVHGMTIMGTDKIYASHLPMFRSPHDYQIILELQLPPAAQKTYLETLKANPTEVLYTIEPEVFVLPTMVQATKKFKANFYKGHFERGGIKFLENVEVTISQVIYFKQFNPKATKPAQLQYILFGNEKEQFLAHQITSRPDFDENLIVKIEDKKVLRQLKKQPYLVVVFEEKDQRKAFSWATTKAQLFGNQQTIHFTSHQTLYLEFGDLD